MVAQIGQVICGHVTEDDLPPADSWEQGVGFASTTPEVRLSCETGQQIDSIRFASLGNPQGSCGALQTGTCHADVSSYLKQVIHVITQFNLQKVEGNRLYESLLCLLHLILLKLKR